MNFTGFVCEYNPFHAGHLAHLDFSRGFGDATLAVMSGCFVQRGEPAVFDPWIRAEAAIASGCDLVILLPTFYALQPAEYFARGAMALLTRAGAGTVTFGSPITDREALFSLSRCLKDETPEFSAALSEALKEGVSYPAAVERAVRSVHEDLSDCAGAVLGNANATLALHYLQALETENYKGAIEILHRPADSLSASFLRKRLRDGTSLPDDALPSPMAEATEHQTPVSIDILGPLFAYLCENKESFSLPDDGEGIESRLRKAARGNCGWDDLLTTAKAKRYTRTRLQRAVLHALLGLDASMSRRFRENLPLFVYPVAMNAKGRELLTQIRKETDLPVVDRPAAFRPVSPDVQALWDLEIRAFDLYRLLTGGPAGQIFTRRPIRIDS